MAPGDGIKPFSVFFMRIVQGGLAPFVGISEASFMAEPMTGRPFNPGRRLKFLNNQSQGKTVTVLNLC